MIFIHWARFSNSFSGPLIDGWNFIGWYKCNWIWKPMKALDKNLSSNKHTMQVKFWKNETFSLKNVLKTRSRNQVLLFHVCLIIKYCIYNKWAINGMRPIQYWPYYEAPRHRLRNTSTRQEHNQAGNLHFVRGSPVDYYLSCCQTTRTPFCVYGQWSGPKSSSWHH